MEMKRGLSGSMLKFDEFGLVRFCLLDFRCSRHPFPLAVILERYISSTRSVATK